LGDHGSPQKNHWQRLHGFQALQRELLGTDLTLRLLRPGPARPRPRKVGVTPIAGWFTMENPNIKWMMTGGTLG